MELFYFSSDQELNSFITSETNQFGAEFLESWNWGEIVQAEGREIIRIGVRENSLNGRVIAAATLIKKSLFGSYFYWYSPRGPVGDDKAGEFLFESVKKIDSRAVFWRFEPSSSWLEVIKGEGKSKIRKTLNLQPAQTLFLDLKQSEESLLSAMHQKTRYNIRLAEKKGVQIISGGLEDVPELVRLMYLTGSRDRFRLHPASHYENLLKNGGGLIRLFLARYQGRNIAVSLVSFFGGRATYLHGASDNYGREVMAPHLLQWETIKRAKQEGYKYYDFYGLDELKWPGVTRFKLGFGGQVFNYPGTFDAIYRPAGYSLYNVLRKLRRLI